MEFRNLAAIIDCMSEWNKIMNNPADVVRYLETGNYFRLRRDKPTTSNLHAYPGISTDDDQLYFFVIDANADRNSSETDLFNAITVCKIEPYNGNGHEIPEIVARRRIENWKTDYADWATRQINMRQQTQGIFKAFDIPSSYAEQNLEYSVFFGLKEDIGSVTGYRADLITTDSSKASVVYFDTVRPVPPFDVLPQASFYLLSMI